MPRIATQLRNRTGIQAGTGQLVSQSSGESVSQSARRAKRVDCVSQENAEDTQRRNCLGHHLAPLLAMPGKGGIEESAVNRGKE
jgi:hypothetical protein